jgi:guanylate kinase
LTSHIDSKGFETFSEDRLEIQSLFYSPHRSEILLSYCRRQNTLPEGQLEESMQKASQRIHHLADLIRKAIEDGQVTDSEYAAILRAAEADQVIDASERALLRQLHSMINDGTIERVRG